MNKFIQTLAVLFFAGFLICAASTDEPILEQTTEVFLYADQEPISTPRVVTVSVMEREPAYDEDVWLIALVAIAEAEGESEEGQRLVIDTILNRRDSDDFPDSIREVVYQDAQFTCIKNGRIDRVHVTEAMYQLVEEEMQSRLNAEVLYFSSSGYSIYGAPMLQVGGHYFSKA